MQPISQRRSQYVKWTVISLTVPFFARLDVIPILWHIWSLRFGYFDRWLNGGVGIGAANSSSLPKVWVLAQCYTPNRRHTFHSITGAKVSGILTPRPCLLPYHHIEQLGRTHGKFIRKSYMLGQGSQGTRI